MSRPRDIVWEVRGKLGLTQVDLARILGVHPLTVSKWERGTLRPNIHQCEILEHFDRAAKYIEKDGALVLVGKTGVQLLTELLHRGKPR